MAHPSMRGRLLVVAVVAAVAFVGAVVAFVELARTTLGERRIEAREHVALEIDRLARMVDERRPEDARQAGIRHFGMLRSGLLRDDLGGDPDEGSFVPVFYEARAEAARQGARTGGLALREPDKGDGAFFVIGARPLPAGGYAWAAEKLGELPAYARWRGTVLSLGVASLALALVSLHTLLLFGRGLGEVLGSLAALRRDLESEVARPAVRELGAIAEGIGALARGLLEARDARERLTRELSRRERLAALGRVVAGVAHEVRNPLAAMKLRVDLALEADDLGPRHAGELAVVSAEIVRLDRLVADLLRVADQKPAVTEPVDLGELAASRVKLLDPWSAERGVQLVARGSAVAQVEVDAAARLVDNLIRNAVEASPAGSVVEVVASIGAGGSRVEVLDEGLGVPEAHRGELFEPFFSTKAAGTGLGLAISRSIAAAHGGALAYRREGERTCFTATFPAVVSPSPGG